MNKYILLIQFEMRLQTRTFLNFSDVSDCFKVLLKIFENSLIAKSEEQNVSHLHYTFDDLVQFYDNINDLQLLE